MNQNKLVDILTLVMPEIVETKDPEKVLLKTASKHNMYPALLEKLGHAFNQMKTIVGLEKQANRGDSFKLLDVLGMVKKYASYDPHKKLSEQDKKVHKAVDNIYKSANDPYAWLADYAQEKPLNKKASDGTEVHTLPRKKTEDLRKLNDLFGMDVEALEDNMSYEIKSAAEQQVTELDRYKDMVVHLNSAEKQANALKANVLDDMEQCAKKFASYLRKNGPECWAEIVEDTVDHFGEKCAAAVDNMENYMEVNHVPYYVADLTKRACTPWLINDRHNCWDTMERVIELSEMYKEASDALIKIEADRENARANIDRLTKVAYPVPPGPNNPSPVSKNGGSSEKGKSPTIDKLNPSNPIRTSVSANKAVRELALNIIGASDVENAVDAAKALGNKELTLQQLMLNDPVLQEADQDTVKSIFDSIASISPTFANDKNLMSVALKEAIQYGALPVTMLKDIASFENSVLDNNKLRNQL